MKRLMIIGLWPDDAVNYCTEKCDCRRYAFDRILYHRGGRAARERMVQNAPAIDPESLRGHAKWVKDKELKFIIVDDENNSHEEPAICCTHCKAKISQSDFDSWVWNFCPVCGFKMEDETEEQHETD